MFGITEYSNCDKCYSGIIRSGGMQITDCYGCNTCGTHYCGDCGEKMLEKNNYKKCCDDPECNAVLECDKCKKNILLN